MTFTVPWDSTTNVREVVIDHGKSATIVGQDLTGNLLTAEFPTDEHAIGHIKEGHGRVQFADGSVKALPPPKEPGSLAILGGLLALAVFVVAGLLVARRWARSRAQSAESPA